LRLTLRDGARSVAGRERDTLRLAVLDDGPGPAAGAPTRGHGVGLGNLRDRLERLYDGRATLRLAGRPSGGTMVAVTLPLVLREGAPREGAPRDGGPGDDGTRANPAPRRGNAPRGVAAPA
jgi:hypothetical protein